MRAIHVRLFFGLGLCGVAVTALTAQNVPADTVYRNGHIYTADASDRIVEVVAIRGGRIVFVGDDAGAAAFVGANTRVVELAGGFAMPGLIDGHMHPLEGGTREILCNLRYESLTVAEFRRRIQACLDADRRHEPDGWLEVVSWFQQSMQPTGTIAHRSMLDSLDTKRPILVRDAFGHTVLANSRALALAGITRGSKDPAGGKIERDETGEPSGLLQDSAYAVYASLVPALTPEESVSAARAALKAIAAQGVTTALDADAAERTLVAFHTLEKAGDLTARMHFAPLVNIDDVKDPPGAIRRITGLRETYDGGPLGPSPRLTVRNAKFFIDGVIAGPAFTGAMIEPYLVNTGTADAPRWVPGPSRGPDPYFAPGPLADLLIRLGEAGIDPHLHVDGDRAVRAGFDAVEAMRKALPGKDVRPAFAHAEIVHPDDFGRFKSLGVYPVLSMQWEKPAPDTVDQLRDYLGPDRAAILEPAGLLAAAGAPIAFGSDWPVDGLDEWFALKVGVTRENASSAGPRYAGRLGRDPGLTRLQALRAVTIMAARELHCDESVGSLDVGKLADLVILDRDPFTIPAADIANVKVKETIVGGRTVYRAAF